MKYPKGTPAARHHKAGHVVRIDVQSQTPYCHTCGHFVGEFALRNKKGITNRRLGQLIDVARQAVEYTRENGRYKHFVAYADGLLTKIKEENAQ